MMKTPKITVIDTIPELLDPLVEALPKRNFQDLARFLQQAQRSECDFLTSILNGCPVGYCLVYWISEFPGFKAEDTPEIVDLIISPDHRRLGIASALLDEIEGRLIAQNHQKVGLTVSVTNTPAYDLYKKRGYQPDKKGLWFGDKKTRDKLGIDADDQSTLMLVKNLLT